MTTPNHSVHFKEHNYCQLEKPVYRFIRNTDKTEKFATEKWKMDGWKEERRSKTLES